VAKEVRFYGKPGSLERKRLKSRKHGNKKPKFKKPKFSEKYEKHLVLTPKRIREMRGLRNASFPAAVKQTL